MVNISGMFSGITKNANKLGTAYGALSVLDKTRGGILDNVQRAIQNRDFSGGIAWLTDINNYTTWGPGKEALDLAIKVGLAGYIADELNIPMVKKFAKPLQKFAWGVAIGLPIAIFILGLGSPASESGKAEERRMFNRAVVAPNQGYTY